MVYMSLILLVLMALKPGRYERSVAQRDEQVRRIAGVQNVVFGSKQYISYVF